jgi:hypothetical protein
MFYFSYACVGEFCHRGSLRKILLLVNETTGETPSLFTFLPFLSLPFPSFPFRWEGHLKGDTFIFLLTAHMCHMPLFSLRVKFTFEDIFSNVSLSLFGDIYQE